MRHRRQFAVRQLLSQCELGLRGGARLVKSLEASKDERAASEQMDLDAL